MTTTRRGISRFASALLALCAAAASVAAHSQASSAPPPAGGADHGPQRPPLFLREEWKQAAGGGEHPVSAASLANPNLELTLILPAGQIMLTGTSGDEAIPPMSGWACAQDHAGWHYAIARVSQT